MRARLDAWIWILVYAGLFAVVLGVAVGASSLATAWTLAVLGTLATISGIVLFAVRARLQEPAVGAQSTNETRRPDA